MIKFIETFDNISQVSMLLDNFGWSAGSIWGVNPPQAPGPVSLYPGMGRLGTQALGSQRGMYYKTPIIPRSATRLVLGIASWHPYAGDGGGANPNGTVDMTFSFCFDGFVNFTISLWFERFNTGWGSSWADQNHSHVTVAMCTGRDGSGYPPITIPDIIIPTPNSVSDYTFVECYVDDADYTAGTAKVAINGKTYVEKTGIITAAYNGFGNDPYDERAKLNNVVIGCSAGVGYYPHAPETRIWYWDTVYLCDDSGGYQDDFLGPIFSKSYYPIANGDKKNWIPYINSEVRDDVEHCELVNDVVDGTELEFLEGDQDLVDEMFIFDVISNIQSESDIVAVSHRTLFRNVASPGNPPPGTLVPIYQAIGNPPVITNSAARKLSGWEYGCLDVYYPIVPALAIPWTKNILEQSQFGFLVREPTWSAFPNESITLEDEVIDE